MKVNSDSDQSCWVGYMNAGSSNHNDIYRRCWLIPDQLWLITVINSWTVTSKIIKIILEEVNWDPRVKLSCFDCFNSHRTSFLHYTSYILSSSAYFLLCCPFPPCHCCPLCKLWRETMWVARTTSILSAVTEEFPRGSETHLIHVGNSKKFKVDC